MTYPTTPGFVNRDTSREAAASIEPHVSRLAGLVLDYIRAKNGATCWEIEKLWPNV